MPMRLQLWERRRRQQHWWILGPKFSTLNRRFCSEFGLRNLPLRGLLHLKGAVSIAIPYKGYVEANLIIPGLPLYNEDVLYSWPLSWPVQIGTLVIDHLVMTKVVEELQHARDTWKQVYLSTVISKRNTVESLNISKYDLEGVKG